MSHQADPSQPSRFADHRGHAEDFFQLAKVAHLAVEAAITDVSPVLKESGRFFAKAAKVGEGGLQPIKVAGTSAWDQGGWHLCMQYDRERKGQIMLTKDGILETLRSHRTRLALEFGVRRIGLFGSYARNEQGETSDIDLLAEFDPPPGLTFIEFTEYLESLFGKSVDVLTPAGIQAIRNPQVAQNIQETVIYA